MRNYPTCRRSSLQLMRRSSCLYSQRVPPFGSTPAPALISEMSVRSPTAEPRPHSKPLSGPEAAPKFPAVSFWASPRVAHRRSPRAERSWRRPRFLRSIRHRE
ncbi:hypothetical protein BJX63DRAFT_378738 [Aspergillus granulosus]|uniref:Uncharacterized protein n=1 Tax=Aspergillus granulosus TaxID=176169 RepID=A0ABR4I1K2_9EURO